jgi:hypothetical protein
MVAVGYKNAGKKVIANKINEESYNDNSGANSANSGNVTMVNQLV